MFPSRALFSLCIAGMAAIWMFWFSGYMLLSAGEITASRSNFLFNADTPVWIERIDRIGKPFWTEFSVSHPLRPWLWGLPARGLAFALSYDRNHTAAAVAAAKLLNAGMFGLAVGALASLGSRVGLDTFKILGVVGFFCLFSANVIVGSTDHFGISIALMIMSVSAVFLVRGPRNKLITQFFFALVIFGTTVTNLLIPFLSMLFILKQHYGWDVRRLLTRRVLLAAMACALVVVVAAFAWRRGYQGGSIILNLLNFRWINDPLAALQYAVAALIYPVLAPTPWIGEHGVTLEPVTFASWSFLYWVGAVAWLCLLIEALRNEWRRPEPSLVFWILLPWALFNVVFHNIWGDEYFLFTPHWSWIFAFCALRRLRSKISGMHLAAISYVIALQVLFFVRVHGLLLMA